MASEESFQIIEGEELYRKLAMGEPIVVLDVRTETEFAASHIPGSILIPLHQLENRIKEVPNSGSPVAVICEHGIRGVSACRFLAEHGIGPLYNLTGGLETWSGPTEQGTDGPWDPNRTVAPARFLVENFDLLPKGLVLDLATGEGRNAIYLATRGFDVDAVDVSSESVTRARARARRLGAPIRAVVGNVEDGTYIIPIETYNLIVVFNFLHRPLFKDIRDGLVPGGVVIYQTFTEEQARFGPPRNPDHLLCDDELREVFADWEVLRYRALVGPSRVEGRMRAIASIVARKPSEG